MEVKSTKNCNPSKDGKVQFNLYINKKENNYSEWKGNITLKVPMDDTISVRYSYELITFSVILYAIIYILESVF